MAERHGGRAGSERLPFEIDTSVAHPARIHNYLSGGVENFAADREAVDDLSAVFPGGIEALRNTTNALRAFMVRALRYLVDEAGVQQFLKIGTTIPTEKDVHELVQDAVPWSRVVYVGSDPVVLAHAHAIRMSHPQGAAAYIHGTLNDPDGIIHLATSTLDFSRPIAVIVLATLNFVPDENDPYGTMARLMESLPPGSYLALAHSTGDLRKDIAESVMRFSESLREPYVVRSHTEIVRFFDGLKMVDPGLVQIEQWPEKQPIADAQHVVPIYGGVGVKPGPPTLAKPVPRALVTPTTIDLRAVVDPPQGRPSIEGRRYERLIRFSTCVTLDDHLAVVDLVRRKVDVHAETAKVRTSEGWIERPSLPAALRLVEPTEEDIEEVHLRLDTRDRGGLTVTSVWRRRVPPFPTITVEGTDHTQVVGIAGVIAQFVQRRHPTPRHPRWRATLAWFRSRCDDLSVQIIGSVIAGAVLAAVSALWLILV